MIMLTAWELWRERNNRVFNRSSRAPEEVFRAVQDEARMWIRAGNRGLETVLPPMGQLLVDDDNHM
jgi:hypothetical protein